MKTKDFRSLTPQTQEEIRIKAVKALCRGQSKVEVARTFGVSRQAVGSWHVLYQQGGWRALRAKPRGRPKTHGALTPAQSAQMIRLIEDRCPEQLKLPFYLWTREAVAQLIERRYGIRLSVWTVGRYLARWGFTPQKPIRRAWERDPKAVDHWLRVEYPRIRALAKREKAVIYWGDEMGVRSDHATGRSYGRKGQTPVIISTGRRFGCNVISAITNKGQLAFMVFKGRFVAKVLVQFMRRLIRQSDQKIFLILDGHPVHRSKHVQNWIEKHADRLSVFFLPSYCPEMNPDELLNQDVKSNAVGRKAAHTLDDLMDSVRGYLRSTQKQPHIVQSYFREKHVQYAAA